MVTLRDIEIMQFIFEHRAVSIKQLANKFFPKVSFQAAYMRLEKLVISKYLVKSFTIWNRTSAAFYGITEKGINTFCGSYKHQITKLDYKSDSINHDLGLVELRARLEKSKMVSGYYSECMLQNCSDLAGDDNFREFRLVNSDAALAIESSESKYHIALEYEISAKHLDDYINKLNDYYSSTKVALVLYICGNARIEKLIRTSDLEIGKKQSKIFTCLEENFNKADGSLSFINRNNYIFKIE
jgi:hypothetical protein